MFPNAKLVKSGETSSKDTVLFGREFPVTAKRPSAVRLRYSVTCMYELTERVSPGLLGFLVYFESEVLKRAHKNFSFLNGR